MRPTLIKCHVRPRERPTGFNGTQLWDGVWVCGGERLDHLAIDSSGRHLCLLKPSYPGHMRALCLLVNQLIGDLPECRWACRTKGVKVPTPVSVKQLARTRIRGYAILVKPVAEDAPCRLGSADLNAL